MKIAVDAMGGDLAPGINVEGAVKAVRELDLEVVLVGEQQVIEDELTRVNAPTSRIEIHHCTQVAGMSEPPIDVVRRKKDSSIRVAMEMVRDGLADAVVSPGNSGATLAMATLVLGRIKGVERAGIAGVFPTVKGRTVVIDMGANVDCKPTFLYDFGLMASAYAREMLGIESPRVGLLSIGEESSKGNDLVKHAHDLLKNGPINFVGNVEGRDIFNGSVDVIVCDGFVGNVVLKLSEGLADAIGILLKQELDRGFWSRLGTLLSMGAYDRFRKRVDYAEFGGAPLLGIKGVGIISHGASTTKAIKNAIRTAGEMVQKRLPQRLEDLLIQNTAQ